MKPGLPRRRLRLLALLGLLAAVILAAVWVRRSRPSPATPARPADTAGLMQQLLALEAREQQAAETHWAKDFQAQRCGRVLEDFWDSINAASNRLAAVTGLPFGELQLPRFKPPVDVGLGIRVFAPTEDAGTSAGLSFTVWQNWLYDQARSGWQLDQVEFRHVRFDLDAQGRPRESRFDFRAHLTRTDPETYAALEGELRVAWTPASQPYEPPAIRELDASRLTLKTRDGPPAFRLALQETIQPPDKSHFIDPLILRDLDGDGRVEIILASRNRIYRLRPDGRFGAEDFCRPPPGLIFTGLIGDFDGDGHDDFLCVKREGLFLCRGTGQGGFNEPGRPVWPAPTRITYGQALTCGDVDGDGDLDVWLGQYKNPYDGGQMPTPYYNANDGNPAYLLLNDGHGNFRDATVEAGLDQQRNRRTYAASLVDLDDDADLDLLVVSDFAGVDLYANDGLGRFADVTRARLDQPRAFGMALGVADFNADGRLDAFVTGMHCPTAQRVVHLGLARPERPDYLVEAPTMISGNKLLLAGENGRFADQAAALGVDRTGWSWGCSAADFDNDGFHDLAIGNGHETRESVREYEPEFWLHDLYAANSTENPVAAMYFTAKFQRTRGQDQSYGGRELNRLFLNRHGRGFVEAAHLLGVALDIDTRNLATGDLDGDGRPDLVLTTFEAWPERRQTLRIFRNELPAGNWLAVQLRPAAGAPAVAGARVTVRLPGRRELVQALVAGDSHRVQHPDTLHFGLGEATAVESVTVRWPGGREEFLKAPTVNRLHRMTRQPRTTRGSG